MARFDYRKLTPTARKELIGELLSVMMEVKSKNDLTTFFLQLVTPSEAVMLARRWQIAKQLAVGKSYDAIAQSLKVGMTTIQAVDDWLSQAIGDYRQRFQEEQARARQARSRRRTTHHLFPNTLPFLLFNLLVAGATRLWWAELLYQEQQDKQRGSKRPRRVL